MAKRVVKKPAKLPPAAKRTAIEKAVQKQATRKRARGLSADSWIKAG